VIEGSVRRSWKIPYVSITAAETAPGDAAKPYDPPPEPAGPTGPSASDLAIELVSTTAKGT
jgi:hypothetical protein